MKREDKFINFPLVSLAYGRNQKDRIETLLQWAVIDVGKRSLATWMKPTSCKLEQKMAEFRLWALADQYGVDQEDHSQVAWALGLDMFGLDADWRDSEACWAAYRRLEAFMSEMSHKLGREGKKPVYVSNMKRDWVVAAYRSIKGSEGKKLEYSYFTVLAAVLSKIGTNKPPCKTVTWREIPCRSLGYANAEEMERGLPLRQDGARPFSRDRIDLRTQKLHVLKFFLRYVPKIGRKAQPAWYGSGIDPGTLVKTAEAAKAKKLGGWKQQAKEQQARMTAMAQQMTKSTQ